MFKVMVREVRPGMKLARPIFHPIVEDQLLLARSTTLTVDDIAQLHELGVYDLWVTYPGLETVDRLIAPETAAAHPRLVEMLRQSVGPVAMGAGASPTERDEAARDLVVALEAAAARPVLAAALASAPDSLVTHVLSVSYLALLLGRRLDDYLVEQRRRLAGARAKELLSLALGCLLHDIGEIRLPEFHREGRRHLHDTDPTWQNHAELGYEMIRTQVEASAAAVVLHHHQHFDGTGFPAGAAGAAQQGAQIHVFARIAAAADVFVHLLHEDGVPIPVAKAWARVQQSPHSQWLDPIILAALVQVVVPFAPGTLVTLSDGRTAIVAETNPESPSQPFVRVLAIGTDNQFTQSSRRGGRLDLSAAKHLWISAVNGSPVEVPAQAAPTKHAAQPSFDDQLVLI